MPITKEQFALIEGFLIPKNLVRGEIFLREGEIAKYGAFVCKGCLRSYVVDSKGKEHVVQFAPENWWLSDIESLLHKTPSQYFMDAIEPSKVILMDKNAFEKMFEVLPGMGQAFRSGREKHAAAKDKRIISNLTADAEERYHQFLETYPTIAQRVPQHMLASYLGISPETLSRVRKKWSLKK